jgi:trans-2-enoyl-CoA reductase
MATAFCGNPAASLEKPPCMPGSVSRKPKRMVTVGASAPYEAVTRPSLSIWHAPFVRVCKPRISTDAVPATWRHQGRFARYAERHELRFDVLREDTIAPELITE